MSSDGSAIHSRPVGAPYRLILPSPVWSVHPRPRGRAALGGGAVRTVRRFIRARVGAPSWFNRPCGISRVHPRPHGRAPFFKSLIHMPKERRTVSAEVSAWRNSPIIAPISAAVPVGSST
jgi:hypothetical protein